MFSQTRSELHIKGNTGVILYGSVLASVQNFDKFLIAYQNNPFKLSECILFGLIWAVIYEILFVCLFVLLLKNFLRGVDCQDIQVLIP